MTIQDSYALCLEWRQDSPMPTRQDSLYDNTGLTRIMSRMKTRLTHAYQTKTHSMTIQDSHALCLEWRQDSPMPTRQDSLYDSTGLTRIMSRMKTGTHPCLPDKTHSMTVQDSHALCLEWRQDSPMPTRQDSLYDNTGLVRIMSRMKTGLTHAYQTRLTLRQYRTHTHYV